MQQFVIEVEKALEEEEMVLIRETDLQVIPLFLANNYAGVLHIEVADPPAKAEVPVRWALPPIGEFILPWLGETMVDILTNGLTWLEAQGGVFRFCDIRVVFYGEVKAFMICKTTSEEMDRKALPETSEENNGSGETDNESPK